MWSPFVVVLGEVGTTNGTDPTGTTTGGELPAQTTRPRQPGVAYGGRVATSAIDYVWRGPVGSEELNVLHAEAFETRLFTVDEWDWARQLERHSFGWVTARHDGELVGFVNVIGDGSVHAWLQDVMVARSADRQGIGTQVVAVARDQARIAGMEWLHVDFDDELRDFYYRACGFRPTNGGLIELSSE